MLQIFLRHGVPLAADDGVLVIINFGSVVFLKVDVDVEGDVAKVELILALYIYFVYFIAVYLECQLSNYLKLGVWYVHSRTILL